MDPHRFPRVHSLSVLALASLALPCAGDTLTLNPGDSLQLAVATANPGDVICLAPGEYVDSGGVVVDKPLSILGAGSERTSFKAVAQAPLDQPLPLAVLGLGPGETVRVVGLTLVSNPQIGVPSGLVVVDGCLGAVVLADVRGTGAFGDPGLAPPGVVQVRQSAQVMFDGCSFSGSLGLGGPTEPGHPTLLVEGSAVWINGTSLLGSHGGSAELPFGSPALGAIQSTLRIARSSVAGGAGLSGIVFPGGNGGLGLRAEATVIELRGGPGNALLGGTGGTTLAFGVPGAGGSAMFLGAGSTLTRTPDAILAAGPGGDGSVTAPVLDPASTGTFVLGTERLASLKTSPQAATLGGSTSTEVAGEPFALAAVSFSIALGPTVSVPGVQGPIVLDLGFFGTVPFPSLDVLGKTAVVSTLPASPVLSGLVLGRQAVTLSPMGSLSISPPTFQAFLP